MSPSHMMLYSSFISKSQLRISFVRIRFMVLQTWVWIKLTADRTCVHVCRTDVSCQRKTFASQNERKEPEEPATLNTWPMASSQRQFNNTFHIAVVEENRKKNGTSQIQMCHNKDSFIHFLSFHQFVCCGLQHRRCRRSLSPQLHTSCNISMRLVCHIVA